MVVPLDKRAEKRIRIANKQLAHVGDRIWYNAARRWIEQNLEDPQKHYAFGILMSGKLQFWIGKQIIDQEFRLVRPRRFYSEHVEAAIGLLAAQHGHARAEDLVTYLLDTYVKEKVIAYINAIIAEYHLKWHYVNSVPTGDPQNETSEEVTGLRGEVWEVRSKNQDVFDYEVTLGQYKGQGRSLPAAKFDAFFNYFFD